MYKPQIPPQALQDNTSKRPHANMRLKGLKKFVAAPDMPQGGTASEQLGLVQADMLVLGLSAGFGGLAQQ